MKEITQLPWFIGKSYTTEPAIRADEDTCVAVACELTEGEAEANAAYIVQACNAFPKMKEALEAAHEAATWAFESGNPHQVNWANVLRQIAAALAAAKGAGNV